MNLQAQLSQNFSGIFETDLIERLAEIGRLVTLDDGETLVDSGDNITFIPLLLEGAIKVMREDESGRELLLYFLEAGDTCAMSMDCCLKGSTSSIRATSEGTSKVLLIPSESMESFISRYPGWLNFVVQNYHHRLEEMLGAIDALAFQDMEGRLKRYLKDRSYVLGSTELEITHGEIALDLNSSRVVISRVMKRLEEQGLIDQKRNKILLHLQEWK